MKGFSCVAGCVLENQDLIAADFLREMCRRGGTG